MPFPLGPFTLGLSRWAFHSMPFTVGLSLWASDTYHVQQNLVIHLRLKR